MLLRYVLPLLLAWVVAGCGYKGALYLPGQSPSKAERGVDGPSDGR